MLKIHNYDIVAQEIPDELTLALNLSLCPLRCKGCHSPWLQTDSGEELTVELLSALIERYAGAVTCVCFMGGDGCPDEVVRLSDTVHARWQMLKTGWYSGRESLPQELECRFDYIKRGAYVEALGGLHSPHTNQRLFAVEPDGSRRVLLPAVLRGTLL